MLKSFTRFFICKRIAALAVPFAVWLVVLLLVQQSAAQPTLNIWSSSGPNAVIASVAVDPVNPNIIYAGVGLNSGTPRGVFKSFNNGASWSASSTGLGNPNHFVRQLEIDPVNPNIIYALVYNLTSSGVYKSTNGGATWNPTNFPPAAPETGLWLEIAPSNSNILYTSGGDKLLVTRNGGDTWEMRALPLPDSYASALAVHRQDPNVLYINVENEDEGGRYKSVNGGLSWTYLTFGCFCRAIEIDSVNPNIIYGVGSNYDSNGSSTGVYKSINSGASWSYTPIATPDSSLIALVIDPRNSQILYAATYSGVYKSINGGATWSAFNNGLSVEVYDLAFDRSGRFLYSATSAGVFRVKVRANPNADFDGDGRTDISVFRPSDRVWYLNQSTQGFSATHFGLSTDKSTPADYDGDGKTDIAVFRDGVWYWLNSSNGNFQAVQFGQAGDIPVPADFTGDGRAELRVSRRIV